jgi:hypothetical protein
MCSHQNSLSLFIAGGSNTERAQTNLSQTTRLCNGLRGHHNELTDVLQEDHEGHEELPVHLKYQVSKMANIGSLQNGCASIGIPPSSQCDVPRYFARFATVVEIEAK